MARSILTPQARKSFSEFPSTIDEYALARYFTLTALDRKAIEQCRGDHNRLGFACHVGWLRWLGWQPDDKRGAPQIATDFLAQQLNLSPACLADYPSHVRQWQLHTEQVRRHLGWRAYQQAEAKALTDWLINEALLYDHARGLLEAAVSYLRRERIVRPGLTVLERVVAAARTEQNHVRSAVLAAFDNGELVDGQPLVAVRVGKIDQPDLVTGNAPIPTTIVGLH